MKSEIREVSARALSVDPKIQRPLDASRVRRIAAAWQDDAVGILTVSDRGNEHLVVIDGQTRLAALRQVAGDETQLSLRCDVFTGLTHAEEAEHFLWHNNRKAVKPLDRFRLSLEAREDWAVQIGNILHSRGWHIVGTSETFPECKSITAITACEKIYARDPESFAYTILAITDAWGHEASAASAHTILGVGTFLHAHPDADGKAFVAKLRKMRAWNFVAGVDDIRRNDRTSIQVAGYQYCVRLYNKGRSAGRIDI
jgi:hypothetical protein